VESHFEEVSTRSEEKIGCVAHVVNCSCSEEVYFLDDEMMFVRAPAMDLQPCLGSLAI
jgi:hypothetical protein